MKVSIHIVHNPQGDYTAICPALPGCACRGSTYEEAQKKMDQAICGYIAAVGNFVPEKVDQEVVLLEA